MTDDASGAWRGAGFRKSSYSGQNAQCVEVAQAYARLGLRDSKNPVGPVLAVAVGQGREFLTALKRGQLIAP